MKLRDMWVLLILSFVAAMLFVVLMVNMIQRAH
jgi:hypothetical protein